MTFRVLVRRGKRRLIEYPLVLARWLSGATGCEWVGACLNGSRDNEGSYDWLGRMTALP